MELAIRTSESRSEPGGISPLSPSRRRASSRPDTLSGDHSEERGLIERLKTGDTSAFDAIFRRHANAVFRIAYKVTRDRTESEDVVQEVFLRVFKKADTFLGVSQFSTWLYRVAVNAALSRMRRKKRSKEINYDDYLPQFGPEGHHLVRPVVDWSSKIDEQSSKQEIRALLNRALSQLRPQDLAVVVLSDVEGFSARETGETLGLTVSAVKARLHRARLFLRGHLAAHLGYSPT